MEEQNKIHFKQILFKEMNEHMRSNDMKFVQVSGFFIGLFAILVSVSKDLKELDLHNLIISFIIFVIGFFVFLLLCWYRKWKNEYETICKNIILYFSIEDKYLPIWLSEYSIKRCYAADKLLLWITGGITIITFLYSIFAFIFLDCFNINCRITVALLFIVIVGIIFGCLLKNTKIKPERIPVDC